MTSFRWISLAAIGCMLAVLGLVSAAENKPRPWLARKAPVDTVEARLRERAGGLNQQAMNLAARYRLLFLLDSSRNAAARSRDTSRVRMFVADGFAPPVRAMIDDAIRRARLARPGDAAGVDVFVLLDTLSTVRGITRFRAIADVRYEIPVKPGDRCRVFVRIGHPTSVRNSLRPENAAQQLLGPCGFFAAFGEPGPRVRQWILDGGWQFTVEGSWTVAPVIEIPRDDQSIFKGPSPALGFLSLTSGGPDCLKGLLDACERAAATRRPAAQIDQTTGSFGLGTRRFFGGTIGLRAGELLSDAVRELGHDRFRTFWTSADSVPVAFQKASGERWGAFIRRWMADHYGAIEPGPRMSGFAIIASTVLVVLALGATMVMSLRRQYA